jgi:hypothetical protein
VTTFTAISRTDIGAAGEDPQTLQLRLVAEQLPTGWQPEDEMAEQVREIAGIPEHDNAALGAMTMALEAAQLLQRRRRVPVAGGGSPVRELRRHPEPPKALSAEERLAAESDARASFERERTESEFAAADRAMAELRRPEREQLDQHIIEVVRPLLEPLRLEVVRLTAELRQLRGVT